MQNNKEYFSSKENLIDFLRKYSPNEQNETFIRGYLGRVLFTSDDALKSVDVLSGGERIRILFAKLMLECPNVLVFEDPTNHLDLESITSLNEGMKNYKGNILFSSHDHELLETVSNRIIKLNLDGTYEDKMQTYDEFMEGEING